MMYGCSTRRSRLRVDNFFGGMSHETANVVGDCSVCDGNGSRLRMQPNLPSRAAVRHLSVESLRPWSGRVGRSGRRTPVSALAGRLSFSSLRNPARLERAIVRSTAEVCGYRSRRAPARKAIAVSCESPCFPRDVAAYPERNPRGRHASQPAAATVSAGRLGRADVFLSLCLVRSIRRRFPLEFTRVCLCKRHFRLASRASPNAPRFAASGERRHSRKPGIFRRSTLSA